MIAGLLLVLNFIPILHTLLFYFGIIILVKGLWIIFNSWQKKIYLDISDWIDSLSGVLMLLIFFGVPALFAWALGIIMLVKGVFSIFNSM